MGLKKLGFGDEIGRLEKNESICVRCRGLVDVRWPRSKVCVARLAWNRKRCEGRMPMLAQLLLDIIQLTRQICKFELRSLRAQENSSREVAGYLSERWLHRQGDLPRSPPFGFHRWAFSPVARYP